MFFGFQLTCGLMLVFYGYYEKHEYRDPETLPRYDFT